jgi:hypothetical protein
VRKWAVVVDGAGGVCRPGRARRRRGTGWKRANTCMRACGRDLAWTWSALQYKAAPKPMHAFIFAAECMLFLTKQSSKYDIRKER